MASGFLLADVLAEALRKPYHQGDTNVTVQYIVEGLKVGEYRVMLKKNFDTACWVPPVGKRASHSIYYGDRMLKRVFERFCRLEEVKAPTLKDFVAPVTEELEAARAKLAAKGKKVSTAPIKPTHTQLYNAQVAWVKANVTKAQWAELERLLVKSVAAYGRHERQHARHTPQDLQQVTRDLRILGIPFMFFNLFEDARIEALSRDELDEPFGWTEIEDLAPMDQPVNIFLRCIQLEGAPDTEALESEAPYVKDPERTVGHIAESVESYYRRAVMCTTGEQLYPVITEFLAEFKEDLKKPEDEEEGEGEGAGGSGSGSGSGGKGKGSGSSSGSGEDEDEEYNGAGERAGDLSTAAEAADKGDEFFTEFDADSEVVGGTDAEGKAAEAEAKAKLKGEGDGAPPKGPGSSKAQGIPESIAPQASGGRAEEKYFLAKSAGDVDTEYQKRVDRLTAMLMRMFKGHTLPAALENPGQRVSSRHLAHGELRFIHKKVMGGKSKRNYTIVYDCSGSMGGRPDREGKLLLLALNNLAKRGFLKGSLILSGWVGHQPGWLQYEFPVKDEIILRINPHHSSEGIQDALRDNLKHIKGMDDVYVYTDANICDAPLDRGYFAKNRIWPVGLYVGSDEMASEMEKHFPQNIIRGHIEEVVEAMLTRNRRTVG